MLYKEIVMDLFQSNPSYALAHCISADCAMLAGIAKQFKEKYPEMPGKVLSSKPKIGRAIGYHSKGRMIFNLVTKERYYQQPTYKNFSSAILDLSLKCQDLNIKKIAIPLLGSGIDGLDWSKNREIIKDTFYHTDIEIMVCKLQKRFN